MHYSAKHVFATAALLLQLGAALVVPSQSNDEPQAKDSCICTMEFAQVCANGKIYPNKCLALCAKATHFEPLEACKKKTCEADTPNSDSDDGCICIQVYKPVCANGKTYSNACRARCEGATDVTPGECS